MCLVYGSFSFPGMRGTALCAAIEARSFEMARYLLDAGCDVNARDFDGEPPLLLALRKVTPCLTSVQNSNQSSKPFKTTKSKQKNQLDTVELIISQTECNLNKFDPVTRNTALHVATYEGLVDVARWLLKSSSNTELNVNLKDGEGNTALHLAVIKGKFELVKLLTGHKNALFTVNTGVKTFIGYPFNLAGLSCIHICAKAGTVECMNELLQRLVQNENSPKNTTSARELFKDIGATDLKNENILYENINALTLFERETCLHIACRNGRKNLVQLLVNWKADVHVKDCIDNSPLLASLTATEHWQKRCNAIPNILLKAGADPNIKAKIHNSRYIVTDLEVTPLIMAALNDNAELAKLLVNHGVNVNDTDSMGRSALFISLSENSLSMVTYLLRECREINVNLKLRDNSTCLHAVSKLNCKDSGAAKNIVKDIFKLGGHISADNKGETPIHRACEYGNHVVLDAILDESEDLGLVELSDKEVGNLLANAASDSLLEIVRVLVSHGADVNDFDEASPEQSCFYAALQSSNIAIAVFLVECDLDISKHSYLKLDERTELENNREGSGNNINRVSQLMERRGNIDDANPDSVDNPDSSDGSANSSMSSFNEHESILNELGDLRPWLLEIASKPRSLELCCSSFIRNRFREKRLPFKNMYKLGLPEKLTNKLRFK